MGGKTMKKKTILKQCDMAKCTNPRKNDMNFACNKIRESYCFWYEYCTIPENLNEKQKEILRDFILGMF